MLLFVVYGGGDDFVKKRWCPTRRRYTASNWSCRRYIAQDQWSCRRSQTSPIYSRSAVGSGLSLHLLCNGGHCWNKCVNLPYWGSWNLSFGGTRTHAAIHIFLHALTRNLHANGLRAKCYFYQQETLFLGLHALFWNVSYTRLHADVCKFKTRVWA